MPLKYSTIHNVKRTTPESEVLLTSADAGSNNNDVHYELFENLKRAFHLHSKKQFGYFEQGEKSSPLSPYLNDYYHEKLSFKNVNQKIAQQLQQQFSLLPPADLFEYYLWVVAEQTSPQMDVYIFLLKHDESHYVSDKLCVENSLSINPDKLQYAAKVDLRELIQEESKTYLSFVSLKTRNAASRVFNNLIGFCEGVDRAEQTDNFLDVVERYANESTDTDHECRHRIIDYCLDQDRQGEPVELQALSRHIDTTNPQAFMNYLADHLDQPNTELYADRNKLKRYTRFYGRDQDLSISFSTLRFGNNIIYDEKSETLTIRAIPESLKSQIKKFLKKTA